MCGLQNITVAERCVSATSGSGVACMSGASIRVYVLADLRYGCTGADTGLVLTLRLLFGQRSCQG